MSKALEFLKTTRTAVTTGRSLWENVLRRKHSTIIAATDVTHEFAPSVHSETIIPRSPYRPISGLHSFTGLNAGQSLFTKASPFSAGKTRQLSTTARPSMPEDIAVKHKEIIGTITKDDYKALATVYAVIKHPESDADIINRTITRSKLPEKTKTLLYGLADRKTYPLELLRGLPDAEDMASRPNMFGYSRPEPTQEPTEVTIKSQREARYELEASELRKQGHVVLHNKLDTVTGATSQAGGKPPSQIVFVSFKDDIMHIHTDSYCTVDDFIKSSRDVFAIDDPADQAIIIDVMTGKESPFYASRQVTGLTSYCEGNLNAKHFCDNTPGYHERYSKSPALVVDKAVQAHLENFLLRKGRIRHIEEPLVSPFDIVRTIIREGEVRLNVRKPLAEENHRAISRIMEIVSGRTYSHIGDYNHFTIDKKNSENSILYSAKPLKEETFLNRKISLLQQEMSQEWLKRGDIFVKLLPTTGDKHNKKYLYIAFAHLAGVENYDEDLGLFRIKSEQEFLKFQHAVTGKEVVLDAPVIASSSTSQHHTHDFLEAVKKGQEDIVTHYLMDGVRPDFGLPDAAKIGNIRMAKILFNAGANLYCTTSDDDYPRNPLHIAALNNRLDFAEYLIKDMGIEVDRFSGNNYYYNTALHYICNRHDNPAFVELLIDSGANVNMQDKEKGKKGDTPLHKAVTYGHVKSIATLLEREANPTIVDEYDNTAFDKAVRYQPREWEKGPQARRQEVMAPLLEYAIDKGMKKEQAYLEQHGAKVSEDYTRRKAQRATVPAKFAVPPVVFYECHDDPAAREAIRLLLPFFKNKGYRTFCLEEDNNNTAENLQMNLVNQIQQTLFVKAKKEQGEKLSPSEERVLPIALIRLAAEISLFGLMNAIGERGIKFKGIDENFGDRRYGHDKISYDDLMALMTYRDNGLAERLTDTAKADKGGTIAIMGADHEPGVHAQSKKRLTDTDHGNILAFHVHSEDREPSDFPKPGRVHFVGLSDENPQAALDKIKKVIENKIREMEKSSAKENNKFTRDTGSPQSR